MMKVLIVEDDPTNRFVMARILRPAGEIATATTGVEAVAAVTAALELDEPYQLICLDIMMPEMDGQEALRRIRQLEDDYELDWDRRARILMTTASTDLRDVIAAFEGLCDGYVVKPIEKAKFIAELHKVGLVL